MSWLTRLKTAASGEPHADLAIGGLDSLDLGNAAALTDLFGLPAGPVDRPAGPPAPAPAGNTAPPPAPVSVVDLAPLIAAAALPAGPAPGPAPIIGLDRAAALLDYGLLALARGGSATAAVTTAAGGLGLGHLPGAISADGQSVTIDVSAADGNGAALLVQLQAIGLQHGSSFAGMASGTLAVSQVAALLGVADLGHARESGYITHAGLTTAQSDASMRADMARSLHAVDGTGIKVGVISDSFATKASPITTKAQDIANGDLPASTIILADFAGGTDEGRGMAQIIHDSAPGSAIYFATGEGGQAAFANAILALFFNAGCKVIVDDLFYFAEPMFQDGVIAQAVNQIVAAGGIYVSSAGNDGNNGYEANWHNGGAGTIGTTAETLMNFGTTVSGVASNFLAVTQSGTTTYALDWADADTSATPGATTHGVVDMAVYLDAAGTNLGFTLNGTAGSPEIVFFVNDARTFYLRVGVHGGAAPPAIKLVSLSNGATTTTFGANTAGINNGTDFGHPAAAGAIAVGAAPFYNTPAFGVTPPTVEPFSSLGPVNIWIDAAGAILASPQLRQTPVITAPDGVNTSFFGSDSIQDADSFPNFFGTSAAAPAAAAVAALMLQAQPLLTAADIRALMMDSAIDMGTSGYDNMTGAGLVQADVAVGYAKTRGFTLDATHRNLVGTHLNDYFDRTASAGANATIDGGAGANTVDYSHSGFSGMIINLIDGTGAGSGSVDRLANIQGVIATGGNDIIRVTGGVNYVDAGAGRDTVFINETKAQASITSNHDGSWSVTGPGGTETLKSVEVARFTDVNARLHLAPRTDFTGDDYADLLWRNTDGRNWIYALNGTAITGGGGVVTVPTSWSVAGTGDFNGDGRADILWRNTNGDAWLYTMDGTTVTGGGFVANLPTSWQVAGIGDFTLDGKADILWRNTNGDTWLYAMDGNQQIAGGGFVANLPTSWSVAGLADFFDDGRVDILWRNTNGDTWIYNMVGTDRQGGGQVGIVPTSWSVLGTGDFNGDGKADILWRNSNGDVWIYAMNGATQVAGGGSVGNVPLVWQLVKIGDVTNDGYDDIIWRNTGTGQVWEYQMHNNQVIGGGAITTVSTDWQVT